MREIILSDIDEQDIKIFSRDFSQFLKLSIEIDRYYAEWENDITSYLPKFEKLADLFNKKYRNIKIKLSRELNTINVRILIDENSVKDLFIKCASKISGLKSIGLTKFASVDISESSKIQKILGKIKNEIYLTYLIPDIGTYNVYLSKKHNEKMIELHWDKTETIMEPSPDFNICAYYALKDGFNKKIKIFDESSSFGFINLLNEDEKREWLDKLNPRLLE